MYGPAAYGKFYYPGKKNTNDTLVLQKKARTYSFRAIQSAVSSGGVGACSRQVWRRPEYTTTPTKRSAPELSIPEA